MEYLDERDKLSNDQHGLRLGRSCVTQLLEIVEVWSSMLDEGAGIDVVYLDFRKPFDSVPHQRLLRGMHMESRVICWNGLKAFLQSDIRTIEKVQRRATKLTSDVKDLEYPDRLRKLKLPTLAYRRLRGDMIQVYKIVHKLIGIKKEILFTMANVETGTRGNIFKLQKARFTIKIRENAFSNKLPDEVVNAKSVNEFKVRSRFCALQVHW